MEVSSLNGHTLVEYESSWRPDASPLCAYGT